MALTTTTITGSIYDAVTGAKRTTGRFYLRPMCFIIDGTDLVSPRESTYNIPESGDLNLAVAPSNGVSYAVRFDPTPADTVTPMALKSGYFKNSWTIPETGPVDLATL